MILLNTASASRSSCLQQVTPPPPSHLSHKGSFYARSGLFFLFVFSIIFALAACNGGGGGSSSSKMQDPSGDGDNGSSDDLNIVFSPVNRTADTTVIGMREFLLTVSASGLEQTQDIVFIVSDSTTAPDWSSVEPNKAKITRTFDNAEKQSREIYFSVTESFPGYNKANPYTVVDLSNDNGNNEVAYMKQQAPGIMVPGQSYYVHIYRDGQYLKTSPAVTLLDYPKASDLPAQASATHNVWVNGPFAHPSPANYSFHMDMWLKPGSDTSFRDLEMRAGEFGLLPLRMIVPIDPDNPISTVPPGVCPTGLSSLGQIMDFKSRTGTLAPEVQLISLPTGGVIEPNKGFPYRMINNPIAFDQNEMFDGFFAPVATSDPFFLAAPLDYTTFLIGCLSANALNSISWKVSLTE